MTTYLVTTELTTSWWIRFLRWLRIKPKRNEFKLALMDAYFERGDILDGGDGWKLKVLKKLK